MPKGHATSHKDITFIVGNPRSKKNVSRIRTHASKKTIKDAEEQGGDPVYLPPKSASRTSEHAPDNKAVTIDGATALSQNASVGSPSSSSQRLHSVDAIGFEVLPPYTTIPVSPASHESTRLLTPSIDVNLAHLKSFDFTNRASGGYGRWWSETSDDEASVLYGSASELYTASAPGLPALPSLRQVVKSATHQANARVRSKGLPYSVSSQRAASGVFNSRRRTYPDPSRPLPLSPEDVAIERCLKLANAFYLGQYESKWYPRLQQDRLAFDMTSDIEMWDESTHTAAALIEVGRTGIAAKIIEQQTRSLESLLLLDHPELFSVLATVALDTKCTPLGQLRKHLRVRLGPAAECRLGALHPLSQLLKMEASDTARAQILILIQQRIFDLVGQLFGEHTYQRLCQFFILATNLEDQGRYGEALTVISAYIELTTKLYGINSLIVVFGLIEQSSIYLAATQPDVRAELHIHDALRRLSIIDSYPAMPLAAEDASAAKEQMTNMVAHCKIAALRILSRLHWMRSNYEAAMHFRQEALDCGRSVLGPDAVPVLLTEDDLNMLEYGRRGQGSLEWPSECRGPEKQDLSTNVVVTEVDGVSNSRKWHTESVNNAVPSYRCAVYGFLQMPTFSGYKIPAADVAAGENLMVSQNNEADR